MKKEYTELKDFIEELSFNRWIIEKSKEDQIIWETWVANHPEKKELMEEAANILIGIQFNQVKLSETKIQEELDFLHAAIREKEAAFKQPKQKLRSLLPKRVLKIAAVTGLLVACMYAISFYLEAPIVKYQTAYGEFEKIQLPDGSQVALNANSSLTYRADHPRKVWLEGEAYFNVLKKATTGENFQVITNDLTVEVLGTSFNVNSRYEKTKVFLEEGKVVVEVVESEASRIEMVPGELLSYSKKTKQILEKKTNQAKSSTSWRNGVIRFDAAPLSTVLQEITTIYGVSFTNKKSDPTDILFSGGIPNNDLTIALENLKEVFGINIEQRGASYIIE